jgi:hypothetical protein
MRGHLTDSEMTEALGGELKGEALAHMDGCPTCRVERYRLRAALTDLMDQARAQAERPEASWGRQRRQIASRLGDRPSLSLGWRWAWAPALLILAALALLWPRGETRQRLPGPEADYALLTAVERSVQAGVPAALQPVALLVAEIERRGTETEPVAGTPKGD